MCQGERHEALRRAGKLREQSKSFGLRLFTRASPGDCRGSAEVVEAVFTGWKGAPPSKS
jgi:hypothetical protein